jgi:predicted DNA-binding transcriptional regulator
LSEDKIASDLKGNTLRVYWFLLSRPDGSAGVREVQRELRFSSPALAAYHLEKLAELGLVENTGVGFKVVKTVSVGVLKQFVRFGTIMLPRHFLYATMFTTLLVFYLTQFRQVSFSSMFALALGVLATVVTWYETFRDWRQRP